MKTMLGLPVTATIRDHFREPARPDRPRPGTPFARSPGGVAPGSPRGGPGQHRAWSSRHGIPAPFLGSLPEGIAAGPDGNLWFAETNGNQIGRITTSGPITEFPIPTADSRPDGITAGPDGNLWFTEENPANKIGRITTAGVIPSSPSPRPAAALRYRGGPGRQPLVHRERCQPDRPDHHRRRRHRVPHPHGRQLSSGHHGGPGRQPLVHRIRWQPRSAGSPPPASSPSSPSPRPAASVASRPVRTATSGSPKRWQPDRPDHDRRRRHRVPDPHGRQRAFRYHGRPGRQPLVHRRRREQDRADHHGRRHHRVPDPHGRRLPLGHHGRPGRQPLVHRSQWQQDRPDHHRLHHAAAHGCRRPCGRRSAAPTSTACSSQARRSKSILRGKTP